MLFRSFTTPTTYTPEQVTGISTPTEKPKTAAQLKKSATPAGIIADRLKAKKKAAKAAATQAQ